jgi:hypothetical protein
MSTTIKGSESVAIVGTVVSDESAERETRESKALSQGAEEGFNAAWAKEAQIRERTARTMGRAIGRNAVASAIRASVKRDLAPDTTALKSSMRDAARRVLSTRGN